MTDHPRPQRRRRRASDKQVERAAALALKHGVKLKLNADGSVEILGRLDSAPSDALASAQEGGADAGDYEAWAKGNLTAGR